MASACIDHQGAVITETGGALCHLAVEGRETDIPIVRVEDALKKFPEGSYVAVDCEKGNIRILPG